MLHMSAAHVRISPKNVERLKKFRKGLTGQSSLAFAANMAIEGFFVGEEDVAPPLYPDRLPPKRDPEASQ